MPAGDEAVFGIANPPDDTVSAWLLYLPQQGGRIEHVLEHLWGPFIFGGRRLRGVPVSTGVPIYLAVRGSGVTIVTINATPPLHLVPCRSISDIRRMAVIFSRSTISSSLFAYFLFG